MNEPKPFASLSPTLLARKGAARPAMRPQLQPMSAFKDSLARQEQEDDLGWNDMGFDVDPQHAPSSLASHRPEAEVVPIAAAQPGAEVPAYEPPASAAPVPQVVRQQAEIAERVAKPLPRLTATRSRRSALADGRRAAFTLRVDAERHLKLRLACTLSNRSAQQMVTEALDRLLDELPEVATLAAQVRNR